MATREGAKKNEKSLVDKGRDFYNELSSRSPVLQKANAIDSKLQEMLLKNSLTQANPDFNSNAEIGLMAANKSLNNQNTVTPMSASVLPTIEGDDTAGMFSSTPVTTEPVIIERSTPKRSDIVAQSVARQAVDDNKKTTQEQKKRSGINRYDLATLGSLLANAVGTSVGGTPTYDPAEYFSQKKVQDEFIDPNSDISQSYKKTLKNFYNIQGIDNLSAYDIKKLFPNLNIDSFAEAEARKAKDDYKMFGQEVKVEQMINNDYKDFTKLYQSEMPKIRAINDYKEKLRRGEANGQGDVQLLMTIISSIDDTAAREGEVANFINSGGFKERLRAELSKVQGNGIFTKEIRDNLISMFDSLMGETKRVLDNRKTRLIDRASQYNQQGIVDSVNNLYKDNVTKNTEQQPKQGTVSAIEELRRNKTAEIAKTGNLKAGVK